MIKNIESFNTGKKFSGLFLNKQAVIQNMENTNPETIKKDVPIERQFDIAKTYNSIPMRDTQKKGA